MSSRSRFLLPLTAAVLLGAALAAHFLWSPLEAPSTPVVATPPAPAPAVGAAPNPAPTPREPMQPVLVKAEAPPEKVEEGLSATVVPVGPGDEVPEPEVENAPPQRNDPIEPELPQTAEWKRGKVVHISELLDRDVARLEQEHEAARSRGDASEVKRLAVQIARHRARLVKLGEEAMGLAETARAEP